MSPVTPAYDLFTTTFSPTGVRTYAGLPPGISWHGTPPKGSSYADPASYPASSEIRPAAYGRWSCTGLTSKGHWVQQAIANHLGAMNLTFFAKPNAVQRAEGTESTTLYWDVSRMPAVKIIEVHAGSVSGPVLAKGNPIGNAHASIDAFDLQDFVLVDVTTSIHKVLGAVTMQAQ